MYFSPETFQGFTGLPTDIWSLGVLLYVSIYRTFPYDLNCSKLVLDKTDYIRECGNTDINISDQCIDLIDQMLNVEYDNRITINEIYDHPWLLN